MYVYPTIIYLFIIWWAFGLFLPFFVCLFVSTFWLLWIMLLWIFVYKLLEHFSILLILYLGVQLLHHNSMCNFLRNSQTVFSPVMRPFLHFHQQCRRVSTSPHPCQHLFSIFALSCHSYHLGCEVVTLCGFDLSFLNN